MWRSFSKRTYSERVRLFASQLSNRTESFLKREINPPRSQLPFLSSDTTSFGRNSNSNPARTFCPFGLYKNYGTSAAQALVSTDESEQSGLEEIARETQEQFKCKSLPRIRKERKLTIGGMLPAKYIVLKRRQIEIETKAWEEAANEYDELLRDMCEQNLAPNLPYVKSLFLGWFEPLKKAILAEQEFVKREMRLCHAHYIRQLPADMLAVITMHRIMGLLMSSGDKGQVLLVTAAIGLGEAVEHEARIHRLLESTKVASTKNDGDDDEKVKGKNDDVKMRKKVMLLMKKHNLRQLRQLAKTRDDEKPWSLEAQVKIGCRLIELLIDSAYIQPPMESISDSPPDIRPAFFHSMKIVVADQITTRRYGIIDCDPLVRKGLEKSARHIVIPYMPMLVPPMKWRGFDKGAHFFLPSFLMRTHRAKKQREAIKKTDPQHLSKVFEALDTLGNTKWRINKRVLAVVDRIWTNGGNLAGIVDREDIPYPEEPNTEDEDEKKKWRWKLRHVKKENRERHSERCSVELKLSVARKLMDEEGFYYPHNLDFRGRAYPMHPHLNHLGSDVCRGILEFAEGRPLGVSGLRWLKIHLANQFGGGFDKLSFDDRVKFAESHVEDIFDSADQPLEGKRWWLNAEDPLQCLATCINLSEALKSPSPHTTISHLPIHQDGSCNGLQHYAALGRDKLGAASVNLVDVDKPADVYSRIAERVADIMETDSKMDPAINKDALHAKLLINQVDRKLVKQTVMTSVYGVTFVGARDQIKQRLKERGVDDAFQASCYVARITLKALDEMFDGARTIMAWLGDCAKLIASKNKAVRWTTPLGLPVVQPYYKLESHAVKTSLQTLTLRKEGDHVMPKRQRTAFPPNLVHSLDGSHMMMTAVACREAGLNFAGVHDSYWTHACDVDTLSRILRHKFVELYDSPILEKLLDEFKVQFPELKFPPVPDRGDFDLKQVLTSRYFFN